MLVRVRVTVDKTVGEGLCKVEGHGVAVCKDKYDVVRSMCRSPLNAHKLTHTLIHLHPHPQFLQVLIIHEIKEEASYFCTLKYARRC